MVRRSYQPRRMKAGVLHEIIRDHLDEFMRAAADRADGAGLPEFITREFRGFLTCGVLAHGFARVRCERCALEPLLPFSCKDRGSGDAGHRNHYSGATSATPAAAGERGA